MSLIEIVLFNFNKNMLLIMDTTNFHTCCIVTHIKVTLLRVFLVFRNDAVTLNNIRCRDSLFQTPHNISLMFSIYIDNLYQKLCHILQSIFFGWHKPLKYGLNKLYYVFCT